MRYCVHCGHIFDEYDFYRNSFNCHICDAVLLEDDMTALKYANLTELEKDAYEEQLLNTIKNSIGFNEELFKKYCSTENGKFWVGFRIDKYAEYNSHEKVEFYTNIRKANEPFQPFPPMDKEKARQHTDFVVSQQKWIEEKIKQERDIPRCPTCQSTNIEKISVAKKTLGGIMFGLFSSNVRNTFFCNNCGYKW